ncbi:MAG: FliH/SctL family protein [Armatimonadota bacterium]
MSSRFLKFQTAPDAHVLVLSHPEPVPKKDNTQIHHEHAQKAQAAALQQACEEARRIIEKAKSEAAAILAAASSEAESIRDSAYRQGYAEGRAEADRELALKKAELEDLVAAVNEERDRFLQEAEPQLVQLALAIASKVVEKEVETAQDVAVSIARACIRRLRERQWLRIHVNPESLESIKSAKEELALYAGTGVRIDLVEDPEVDPGGCIIESSSGIVDARIQTRMDLLKSAVEEALNDGEAAAVNPLLQAVTAA